MTLFLASSALNVAVMDLGILPESIEPLIVKARINVQGHASMRLQAVQFKTFSNKGKVIRLKMSLIMA